MRKGRAVPMMGLLLCAAGLAILAGVVAYQLNSSDDGAKTAGTFGKPVSAAFKPSKKKLADCTSKKALCLEQAFGNLAYHKGAKVALAAFSKGIDSDPKIESDCHRIGHKIGAGALLRNKGDVGKTFAQGAATCWSGYYHGILERSYYGVPENKLSEVSSTLCSSKEVRKTQFLHYQCVHGIGHGLMIYTGYDLPRSLKVCEGIKDKWESTSCDGGIFMENQSTSYGTKSKYIKTDDLVYPCNMVAERHKLYCYLMVTSHINEVNGFNWKKTAALCAKTEKNWVVTCFQSYGRDASGHSRQDPVKIQALCTFAGTHYSDCIYGGVRDMASNYHGGKEASQLCAITRDSAKAHCYNGVGTIIGTLRPSAEDRRADCDSVSPEAFRKDCYSGSGADAAPANG